jgi:outer membrane lipoprotein-sorting protein
MKKLTITIIATFVMSFAAFSQESSENTALIPSSHNTFKLIYNNSGDEVVKIKIKDEEGQLLRIDKIKSNGGFMKRYNLTQLDPGKYTFEISDAQGITSEEVNLQSSNFQTLTLTAQR